MEPGSLVELEPRFEPVRLRWLARHAGYRENEFFSDEQVRGPFRFWRHRHGSEETVDGRCVLADGGRVLAAVRAAVRLAGGPGDKTHAPKNVCRAAWAHCRGLHGGCLPSTGPGSL
jgi:hypothetical protein